jgi:uncharacterized protein (DUF433 family)
MERRHFNYRRITIDPEKCGGKPCIRGLRMPVESLLRYLASGMTVEDILREWPELEEGDIKQAQAYAADVMGERVLELMRTPGRAGLSPKRRGHGRS